MLIKLRGKKVDELENGFFAYMKALGNCMQFQKLLNRTLYSNSSWVVCVIENLRNNLRIIHYYGFIDSTQGWLLC